MQPKSKKPEYFSPKQRKKHFLLGVGFLGVMILMAFWAVQKRAESKQESAIAFEKARVVIAKVVSGDIEGCGDLLLASKEQIAQQFKRAKATQGFLNTKAMVYDQVIREVTELCRSGNRHTAPETRCENPQDCFDNAMAWLINGKTKAALGEAGAGLAYEDNKALRELLALLTAMQNEAAKAKGK